MSEDGASTADIAAHMAMVTMQFINMVAFLASPRVVAASGGVPPREHLLSHIDEFVAALPSLGAPGDQARSDVLLLACALRDLVREWMPDSVSPCVPPLVQEGARALLRAQGIPEPPGGWDHFEAPKDDEEPVDHGDDGPTSALFPGEDRAVYLRALRVSITGDFLSSLADGGTRTGPGVAPGARGEPTLDCLKQGADRLLLHSLRSARCLELLSPFLSRHAASRARRLPARDALLDHLAAYIEFSTSLLQNPGCEASLRIVASAAHAARLGALFRAWTPGADVPAEIIGAVRDLFGALGLGESAEGWERFEGFAPRPGAR